MAELVFVAELLTAVSQDKEPLPTNWTRGRSRASVTRTSQGREAAPPDRGETRWGSTMVPQRERVCSVAKRARPATAWCPKTLHSCRTGLPARFCRLMHMVGCIAAMCPRAQPLHLACTRMHTHGCTLAQRPPACPRTRARAHPHVHTLARQEAFAGSTHLPAQARKSRAIEQGIAPALVLACMSLTHTYSHMYSKLGCTATRTHTPTLETTHPPTHPVARTRPGPPTHTHTSQRTSPKL